MGVIRNFQKNTVKMGA